MRKRCVFLAKINVFQLLEAYCRGERCIPSEFIPLGVAGMKPTLLVSACLLGQRVTYRGGSCASHVRHQTPLGFLVDFLWREHRIINCIPICPEMDLLALPSPRPPLRLVRGGDDIKGGRRCCLVTAHPAAPHVVGVERAGLELRLLRRHPRLVAELLAAQRLAGIDGCVLKSRSPSCGVTDARLYATAGGVDYEEVDGFFVAEWLRPAAGAVSVPLVTERQLRAGGGIVTSFVADVWRRFDFRLAAKMSHDV